MFMAMFDSLGLPCRQLWIYNHRFVALVSVLIVGPHYG